jgi:hypothetical protein
MFALVPGGAPSEDPLMTDERRQVSSRTVIRCATLKRRSTVPASPVKLIKEFVGTLACLIAATSLAVAQSIDVVKDTNVNLNAVNQVHGADETLLVRNVGGGGTRRSFLQFDLSTLPPGSVVSKATMRVFVNSVATAGTVDVLPILGPWQEATVSAANAPTLGAVVSSADLSAADELHFRNIDITNLVRGWLATPATNFGLALVPGAGTVRVSLDSKESTTTSHAPELDLVLQDSASQPLAGC